MGVKDIAVRVDRPGRCCRVVSPDPPAELTGHERDKGVKDEPPEGEHGPSEG
jgi:hypothetical protein